MNSHAEKITSFTVSFNSRKNDRFSGVMPDSQVLVGAVSVVFVELLFFSLFWEGEFGSFGANDGDESSYCYYYF